MDDGASSDAGSDLQTILDALDDPTCRDILRTLDDPMTAKELMAALDLSQTTAYRKLDLLTDAGLLTEETELRRDGHHTARYRRAVDGVTIELAGGEPFSIETVPTGETGADRLARFWTEMGEEL